MVFKSMINCDNIFWIGMLEKLTGLIVEPLAKKADGADVKILKYITEPFTDLIVMVS